VRKKPGGIAGQSGGKGEGPLPDAAVKDGKKKYLKTTVTRGKRESRRVNRDPPEYFRKETRREKHGRTEGRITTPKRA